jgi:micrococcal nuclease
MLRNRSPKQLFVALLILVLVGLGLTQPQAEEILSDWRASPQPGYYRVEEVVDGDTITIDMNGTIERVRFIGLDTPEKNHPEKPVQCFAEAASAHLKELIGDEDVRLEADPTNQNRDRYGRLLRYVYTPESVLLNAQMILDGYGFAYTAFPFERMFSFIELEEEAKAANRGLWANCEVYTENGYLTSPPVN